MTRRNVRVAAQRRSRHAVCALGLIAALLSVLLPSAAWACSCVGPFLSFVAPADRATGVPLNTRIWIGAGEIFDAPPHLAVELHEEPSTIRNGGWTLLEAPNAKLHVFTPAAELKPNTRYRIVINGERRAEFTTGEARDEEAPASPVLVGQEENLESSTFGAVSSCGESATVALTVESDAPILLLDRAGTSGFDPTTLHGSVTAIEVDQGTTQRMLVVGQGGCTSNWPEAGRGESTQVRLGAMDLAGNFSGFGAAEEIGFGVCGCSSGSGAVTWAGLAGALAFLLRRRR